MATSCQHVPAAYPLPAGFLIPTIDFETYSEAGYYFDGTRWRSITKSPPHGLGAVGAPAYSEHASTEIISLSYDLLDGRGAQLWTPGDPPPVDLFAHIQRGGLIEAHNAAFEYWIWLNVAAARLGWPALPREQIRDSMAKCYAHGLPGKLEKAGEIIKPLERKNPDGDRLIKKFSKPRHPTKKDPRRRIRPAESPEDAAKFYEYNRQDVRAEMALSSMLPELAADELQVWLADQAINARGVHIDRPALDNCAAIVDQARAVYTDELRIIAGCAPTEVSQLLGWINGRGVGLGALDADTIAEALKRDDLPADIRRALEIRASLAASSVGKLYAIQRRLTADSRLHDIFAYCGADRTGRWAGRGPQPQNLPSGGPAVKRCQCGKHYAAALDACPWCGAPEWSADPIGWNPDAVEDALTVIATQSLVAVEYYFGDAIATVSGCLRGLFCAAPGYDLVCSDYSAIEAVVLAAIAGEQWRLEVFRTHGLIYETSASKITGVPLAEYVRHKAETGQDHPHRKKIGKVAELASGYQGSVGAWKQFGAKGFFDDDAAILEAVRAWRKASPMIVKLWYRLDDCARDAVTNPGKIYEYRGIKYQVRGDVLYCRLLSGRELAYHQPRLKTIHNQWGKLVDVIKFWGWNTDYTKGPRGWIELETYGGKLTENVIQATARDILAHALVNAERAGYSVVMHVHDEPAAEVPEGVGSVEQFEKIIAQRPAWCADWPIKAAGGWRGKRFRKDS